MSLSAGAASPFSRNAALSGRCREAAVPEALSDGQAVDKRLSGGQALAWRVSGGQALVRMSGGQVTQQALCLAPVWWTSTKRLSASGGRVLVPQVVRMSEGQALVWWTSACLAPDKRLS